MILAGWWSSFLRQWKYDGLRPPRQGFGLRHGVGPVEMTLPHSAGAIDLTRTRSPLHQQHASFLLPSFHINTFCSYHLLLQLGLHITHIFAQHLAASHTNIISYALGYLLENTHAQSANSVFWKVLSTTKKTSSHW